MTSAPPSRRRARTSPSTPTRRATPTRWPGPGWRRGFASGSREAPARRSSPTCPRRSAAGERSRAPAGSSGRPTPDPAATRRVLDELRRRERLHGFTLWAVDERDGDRLIGLAGLSWVEGHGPEVEAAYLIRRDGWGRGYATEALQAVLRIGHDELGLDRIVALAYPENVASQRVMAKAGMAAGEPVVAYGRQMCRYASLRA